MQNKNLHKLGKTELLEIIYEQEQRIEELNGEIHTLNKKLEDRTIKIQKAGSIAEVSIRINEIFETAQKATDEYLRNIKNQNPIYQDYAERMISIPKEEIIEKTIEKVKEKPIEKFDDFKEADENKTVKESEKEAKARETKKLEEMEKTKITEKVENSLIIIETKKTDIKVWKDKFINRIKTKIKDALKKIIKVTKKSVIAIAKISRTALSGVTKSRKRATKAIRNFEIEMYCLAKK